MHQGLLVVFEGIDGSGKTTLAQRVLELLTQHEESRVHLTREPGGTLVGEEIRRIFSLQRHAIQKHGYGDHVTHENEKKQKQKYDKGDVSKKQRVPSVDGDILLHFASRAYHLDQLIVPLIKNGYIVLCDRFIDSTYAYQHGGFLGNLKLINFLEEEIFFTRQIPMITFFLDITQEEARKRRLLRCSCRKSEKNVEDSNIKISGVGDNMEVNFYTRVFNAYKKRFTSRLSTASIVSDESKENNNNQEKTKERKKGSVVTLCAKTPFETLAFTVLEAIKSKIIALERESS